MTVAALFLRANSIYKSIPDVDCYDIERDARSYRGPHPVIAHPPCRSWGSLRHCAKPRYGERKLAYWAVAAVRRYGGVLEHPAWSQLWPSAGLVGPGCGLDEFGGFTLPVNQFWWGHKADKATWLYIVGCPPRGVPDIPMVFGEPSHVVTNAGKRRFRPGYRRRPELSQSAREATPVEFAHWLVELATRCGKGRAAV